MLVVFREIDQQLQSMNVGGKSLVCFGITFATGESVGRARVCCFAEPSVDWARRSRAMVGRTYDVLVDFDEVIKFEQVEAQQYERVTPLPIPLQYNVVGRLVEHRMEGSCRLESE